MSAEMLREAAALMRERAQACLDASPDIDDGHWWSATTLADVLEDEGGFAADKDADHIASWHPLVAQAVADWLDAAYAAWMQREHSLGAMSVRAMSGESNEPDLHALAVAHAYLGEPS